MASHQTETERRRVVGTVFASIYRGKRGVVSRIVYIHIVARRRKRNHNKFKAINQAELSLREIQQKTELTYKQ